MGKPRWLFGRSHSGYHVRVERTMEDSGNPVEVSVKLKKNEKRRRGDSSLKMVWRLFVMAPFPLLSDLASKML